MRQQACHCCHGSGKELHHREVGLCLRRRRKELRVSLETLAARMGYSEVYLSQLENGKRRWNERLLKLYETNLK